MSAAKHTPACLVPDSDEQEFLRRYATKRASGYPMGEAAKAAHRDMEADASNMATARAAVAKATGEQS